MKIRSIYFSTLLAMLITGSLIPPARADAPDLPAAKAEKSKEENTAAFLQGYLDAKQKAVSQLELQAFFLKKIALPPEVLRLNRVKRAAFDKMSVDFFQEEKSRSPRKIEIEKTETRKAGTLVTCIATDYEGKDKDKSGAYFNGKYLLCQGPNGWQIVEEFWTRDDGNGRTSQNGRDPDQPLQTISLSPDDIYKEAVEKALSKVWSEQNTGEGDVIFELQNNSSGKFLVLVVNDKRGNVQAEAKVKAALAKLVLPPLPAESKSKILHVEMSWSPKSLDTRETQYFTEPFYKPSSRLQSKSSKAK